MGKMLTSVFNEVDLTVIGMFLFLVSFAAILIWQFVGRYSAETARRHSQLPFAEEGNHE